MNKENRSVIYDADLGMEAYHFQGLMQKFPNHFHDYYVIGFIEKGRRHLVCRNKDYILDAGDMVLFNPRDNHACEQVDGRTLDYRCINVTVDVMKKAMADITGREILPCFTSSVVFHTDMMVPLQEFHRMVFAGAPRLCKEEAFLFLVGQLVADFTKEGTGVETVGKPSAALENVRRYLEKHYCDSISLDDLVRVSGLSKYYLLRSFTHQVGITPYRYVETLRINQAKKLLEQGVPLVEAALSTGFSDQSHFSRFFKSFIGLPPRQYAGIFSSVRSVVHHAE